MMRILYVTTVGSTMYFFKDLIRDLLDEGHTVDIACNESIKPIIPCYREWGCTVYPISCTRSPFSRASLTAIKEIRDIVTANNYDIVHCHKPVAAACARIACRKLRKHGLTVIYTSHGFHFYKGAPLKNRIVYYPIEKFCSRFTDVLITINKEDFEAAKKLHAGRVEQTPGVGIDVEKYKNVFVDRDSKRASLGIPDDAFVLISVGELNENKNHSVVIRALEKLADPRIYYLIAGEGGLKNELEQTARKVGLSDRVKLLGFRTDVPELYKISDVILFPSIREGLGLVSVEGMAAGLPLICADNRGTREYSAPYRDEGLVCQANDPDAFANAIRSLANDPEKCARLGAVGPKCAEAFSVKKVIAEVKRIYFGDRVGEASERVKR